MGKYFLSLLLIILGTKAAKTQENWEITSGAGVVFNFNTQTYFNSTDFSFDRKETSENVSYGLNLYGSYYKKVFSFRSGIKFANVGLEGFFINVKRINTFSIPLYVGVHWKSLRFFTGLDFSYSLFTFRQDSRLGMEITRDNCACELNDLLLNYALNMEFKISERFNIGVNSLMNKAWLVESKLRLDELRSLYFYMNYNF